MNSSMRLPAVVLAGLATLAASPAAIAASDSGVVKQPIRTEPFTGVVLSGMIDVTIGQAGAHSVVASGTEAALSDLKAEVKDGKLHLAQKSRLRIGKRGKVRVTINMPDLQSLELTGSGDVTISNMKLDKIALTVTGAGDVTASGTCNDLHIQLTGAGDITARDLKCHNVSAQVSGSGDISLHADRNVSARVSGVSDLDIYGNPPERSVKVGGVGDVHFHDTAR